MRKTRKRQIAAAGRGKAAEMKRNPDIIKARANDVFSNALARLGAGTPNLMEGTDYLISRLTRDYGLLIALYRGHWIIKRIIVSAK